MQFRRLQGYLPRVIAVHIGNPYEEAIADEVAHVAQDLEVDVSLGHEDMTITV